MGPSRKKKMGMREKSCKEAFERTSRTGEEGRNRDKAGSGAGRRCSGLGKVKIDQRWVGSPTAGVSTMSIGRT
jgi:hypothetical protein